MGVVLTGRVYQDLRQGASFTEIDWVKRTFQEKLGFTPYPGTFNLMVEGKEQGQWTRLKSQWAGIDIPPGREGFCRSRCYHVVVEGKIHGAIVFPEVKDYPGEKLEILAPVHVKESLNVKDGDWVTIEIFESSVVVQPT